MKNKINQVKSTQFNTFSTKKLIVQFIENCISRRNSQYVAILKRKNLTLYEFILKECAANSPLESIYQYIHNKSIPLCKHCTKNHVKFINYKKGYAQFCCKSCSDKSDITKEKRSKTNLVRYGNCCAVQSEHGSKKRKETMLGKYGVEHFSKTKEFKNKFTATMKKRYGVEYAMQSDELKEKYCDSLERNHGVRHPSKSKEIYKNRNKAMQEKYGVEYAMQSDELKERHRLSLQSNYGVDIPLQSKKIQDKFKNTMRERYGAEYTANVDWLFTQMKQTNLERYGVEYLMQSDEFKEKTKQTNLERYGVEYPMQSDEFKEKTKQTNLERYGVEYPIQNEDIKNKIRLKMEKEGKWIPNELLSDAQMYYKQVIKYTYKQPLHLLENIDKRGRAGKDDAYHIDHKVSIKYGFENSIPPYIIGNINNLEMLPWYDNIYKSSKCSIDPEELIILIQK